MTLPAVGEHWSYKANRGYGTFTVVRVTATHVHLRGWSGQGEKRIRLATLRSDYEKDS
jgi:hypothetical protein